MQKYIISCTPHNGRSRKLRLKGKCNSVSLISVHAATEDKMDDIHEQCYVDLQKAVDSTPKRDTVITLGDLNARLRKERYIRTQVRMAS
jgi:hypothetical protein